MLQNVTKVKTISSIVRKPTASELLEMYWKHGLATRKIAKIFGTHKRVILLLMQEYGISRRNRIDAVIKGCRKYEKIPFSGDINEQAYILGLTLADFRRRKHGYQIDIALSTTHPAFRALFKTLFEKYAPIGERPYYNPFTEQYGWRLETQLHPSFDFLLSHKRVPKWVSSNKEAFLHFLAGYVDGEGTISISKNSKNCMAFIFAISSEDKAILYSIFRSLTRLGFNPSFRKLKSVGDTNKFYGKILRYTKDTWMLRLKRRAEVLHLLSLLPIKHPEKIKKRDFMMRFRDKIYINEINEQWLELKNQIKSEVKAYLSEAERESRRRNFLNNSDALA